MSDWVEIILRANTRTAPFSGAQARKTALGVTAVTLKIGNHDYTITRVYEFGGAVRCVPADKRWRGRGNSRPLNHERGCQLYSNYTAVGIRVCTVVGDCGIRLGEAEAVAAGVPWATVLFMGCGDIARASRSADVKGPANELAV